MGEPLNPCNTHANLHMDISIAFKMCCEPIYSICTKFINMTIANYCLPVQWLNEET